MSQTTDLTSINQRPNGCVLCGSTETRYVKSLSTSLIVDRWKDWMQIDVTKELPNITELKLHQCSECELGFFSPHPITGSAKLYEELGKLGGKDYYPENKWEFLQALKDLKNCRRILEIGSGSGEFIKIALSHGLSIEGIEINNTAVNNAQNSGLPIRADSIEEIVKSGNQYDGICSFQVLEHVEEPFKFLETAAKALVKKGKLIIAVPNAKSFLKYQYNLLDMPPHHLTRWTTQTFATISHSLPLKLIMAEEEPLDMSHAEAYLQILEQKMGRFRRVLGSPIKKTITRLMCQSPIRHYLKGHNLYVVFEKM